MDKKTFLSRIPCEDKALLSKIYEKISLAERINKTVYSNEFYTPNIWKKILDMQLEFDVNIYCEGIFQDSERKMLAFSNIHVYEYPVVLIKIVNKSKFHKLKHKDYLGAIMSLGIAREKIGDLILDEENEIAYLVVYEDIYNYILVNLSSVGKCPCEIIKLNNNEESLPKYKFDEKEIIVSSLRGDCVVASLCNISRNAAVELIKAGKVIFDYDEIYNKDENVKIGCTIIIKKYGKYKISKEMGYTGKDRMKILIKKFI